MNASNPPALPVSIASIGECMIELSRNQAGGWSMGYAGDTFNTLWAIRALLPPEAIVDYVSAFGDDPFSAEQRAFFHAAGIGTAESPVIAGARPGLYAITLNGAERMFTYWRSDAAARRLADDPPALAASLSSRRMIYFSGITLAILEPRQRDVLLDALAAARAAGSIIAFDPNYRPRLWPDLATARTAIDSALPVCDIVLPTFADEQQLYGDATPEITADRLARSDISEIVVKNGSDPSLAHTSGNRESHAASSVAAVDTTGAGDSFNAGYLAARLLGLNPFEAVRRAHNVAAEVVQVRGALAPFETLRFAFGQGTSAAPLVN